jgi:hypothetical protein
MLRELDLREIVTMQQRLHAAFVRPPPIGLVPQELVTGIERHRGTIDVAQVKMRFNDQQLSRQAGDARKRFDRILTMIKDAKVQYDIELTDGVCRELRYIDFTRFRVKAKHGARQIEGLAHAIPGPGPCNRVGCQHTSSATSLGFEAEKSIPRANIKHSASAQIDTPEDGVRFSRARGERLSSGRHHAIAKVD